MKLALGTALAALLALPAVAQTAATPDPDATAKLETARLTAEAALVNARATLTKAKVDALGLPSFEGKTTLNTGAGAMEVNLMIATALPAAASEIATRAATASTLLVLAGDETVDLGLGELLRAQLEAVRKLFVAAGLDVPTPAPAQLAAAGVGGAVAVVSALAGLLRSETTVTAVDGSFANHRLLATAVAARHTNAVVPSALIATASDFADGSAIAWDSKSLIQKLDALANLRAQAAALRKPMGDKPDAAVKPLADKLDLAIARYDELATRATKIDDKGNIPIVAATRLAGAVAADAKILRVYLEKSGGSLINSKNLATTLGLDPVKVSSGLIASYALTDPRKGKVEGFGTVTCRTTLTSLRSVHEGSWRPGKRPSRTGGSTDLVPGALCDVRAVP